MAHIPWFLTAFPLVNLLLILLNPCLLCQCKSITYKLHMELYKSDYSTDTKFVSFAVGTRVLEWMEPPRFEFTVQSVAFQNLAKALAPVDLRIGGTFSNFRIFLPTEDYDLDLAIPKEVVAEWENMTDANFWYGISRKKSDESTRTKILQRPNRAYTGFQWSQFTNFTKNVGWDVLFDANQALQRFGKWDPSNFKLFLDYSQRHGIDIPGFQLGNEPMHYPRIFNWTDKTPASSVTDFRRFNRLRRFYPEYKNSKIIGPDISKMKSSIHFLKGFLSNGGNRILDAIGVHFYYFNGRTAKAKMFISPEIMDKFKPILLQHREIRDKHAPGLPIYFTETGNAYGGGAPRLSHCFISTFIYLDQLGMAAKYGVGRVYRQTFSHGHYGVIDHRPVRPFPDYYVALLYKRLVEGPVLNITVTPENKHLRVYAHCARRDVYRYRRGSVVVYYLNIQKRSVTLDLGSKLNSKVKKAFILTSGDPKDLTTLDVKLNGKTLHMTGDDVPELKPLPVSGPITVPEYSLGFVVLERLKFSSCWRYKPQKN